MEKQVFSLKEFSVANGIGMSSLYELLKSGRGPKTIRVGRRRLIGVEAAKEWRLKMSTHFNVKENRDD